MFSRLAWGHAPSRVPRVIVSSSAHASSMLVGDLRWAGGAHARSHSHTQAHCSPFNPRQFGKAQRLVKGVHLYLLSTPLICPLVLMVDSAKVGHDDGHGQSYYQYPAQRADGTENLPRDRLGHHVSVTGKKSEPKKRRMRQTMFCGGNCCYCRMNCSKLPSVVLL